MGYTFGNTSKQRLDTAHKDLREVMEAAIKTSPVDFSIVCGHRTEEAQMEALEKGYSQVPWPLSRHNMYPSTAVDVCPYVDGKLVWDDDELWEKLFHHIMKTAIRLNIRLLWGGSWTFVDKPHFQLDWRLT